MSDHYPIQGVPVSPGQRTPLRREFNDWARDHENNIQVSLLIRALQKFYEIPYTSTKSYFQVAGIHGYPGNLQWNGAPGPTYHRNNDDHKIYCTHNLIIFPTWHRVYMLLFEQRIHELMIETIDSDLNFGTDVEKQRWTEEANQWRLPYWNWALPKAGLGIPPLFTLQEINIRAPMAQNGTTQKHDKMDNPLFRYKLQVDKKATKMGDLPKPYKVDNVVVNGDNDKPLTLPWSECSGTSRWGINSDTEDKWSSGVNNWAKTNIAIQAHQYEEPGEGEPYKEINKHAVSDIVYRILTKGNLSTLYAFSTTAAKPKEIQYWTDFLSLEYIHNNLHGFIGGDDLVSGVGHMQNVPVAAFDPVFWIHHCNIDLYLAIWQTLNHPTWFAEGDTPNSRATLSPFYRKTEAGEIKLYTSDDVQTWTDLGYQYDVLERKAREDDTAYEDRIKEYVDSFPHTGKALLDASSEEQQVLDSSVAGDNSYNDYVINVFYDRNALGGDPYTIHFFLGKVSDLEINSRTEIIAKHPKHVGSVYTFTAQMNDENNERCGNCAEQAEAEALSTAQIPITLPLLKQAADPGVHGISNFDLGAVKRYLIDNLDWRAINVIGQIIPAHRLQKIKIFALKGKAKHYRAPNVMSEYMEYLPMPEVTDGKPLGAAHGDYESPSYGYE